MEVSCASVWRTAHFGAWQADVFLKRGISVLLTFWDELCLYSLVSAPQAGKVVCVRFSLGG